MADQFGEQSRLETLDDTARREIETWFTIDENRERGEIILTLDPELRLHVNNPHINESGYFMHDPVLLKAFKSIITELIEFNNEDLKVQYFLKRLPNPICAIVYRYSNNPLNLIENSGSAKPIEALAGNTLKYVQSLSITINNKDKLMFVEADVYYLQLKTTRAAKTKVEGELVPEPGKPNLKRLRIKREIHLTKKFGLSVSYKQYVSYLQRES